jgi:transporter family protein
VEGSWQPVNQTQLPVRSILHAKNVSTVSRKAIIGYAFLISPVVLLQRWKANMSWFLWALLSAFFAGLTAILAKVGVENVNSNLATAIRTLVILIFAWSVALFTKTQSLASIGKRTWIFLILSGIATGLSWLCYFRALQLGEASQVAPVDKLSVVIAIALAAIFLHEHLTWHHWLGGTLIVTGAMVLAYAR